jgi:hypothetical protein
MSRAPDALLPPASGETCLDRALRLRTPLSAPEVLVILRMQMRSHGDVMSFGLPARPSTLPGQTGVFIEHPKLRRQSNADRWKQRSRSVHSSEYAEAYGLVTAQAGFKCRYYEHCFSAAALGGLDGLKHPGCCTTGVLHPVTFFQVPPAASAKQPSAACSDAAHAARHIVLAASLRLGRCCPPWALKQFGDVSQASKKQRLELGRRAGNWEGELPRRRDMSSGCVSQPPFKFVCE